MTVPDEEFRFLRDNAAEAGVAWSGPPTVERIDVRLAEGRAVSAVAWGGGEAEAVMIHGGSQNAHTWDTVALALSHPFLAVDLPGHGRSDWRSDHDYRPSSMAADVAVVVAQVAPSATLLVGMSLGGLTSIAMLDGDPGRFEHLVLVDITPGVSPEKAKAITDFTSGPERFGSFEEILDRTVRHHPTRSEASLRRGILHNAMEDPDGSWRWRWDPERSGGRVDVAGLWDVLGALTVPVTLVRGGLSPVVDDADVAELRRRLPHAEVLVVEGAGHSVQGDRPVELAAILAERLTTHPRT